MRYVQERERERVGTVGSGGGARREDGGRNKDDSRERLSFDWNLAQEAANSPDPTG